MVAVLDTIAAATLGLLLVAYVFGLPVTLIVSGVSWRTRTRTCPAPAAIPADLPAAAPAPAGPLTAPAFAPSPVGPALLRLSNLERQVLALREAPAPAEVYPRLAAEAGELLGRYGTESVVGRHATGLLAIVEGLAPAGSGLGDAPPVPALPPPRPPDRLRVSLGRFASAGEPVPVAWAFCWLGHLPDRWPPHVPGHELARAFAARYSEAYPLGGMTLPWTGHRLALRYTPASARFGGQELVVSTGLPDVAGLPEALHQLRALGAAAVRDLVRNR
jgi:TerB-like protein